MQIILFVSMVGMFLMLIYIAQRPFVSGFVLTEGDEKINFKHNVSNRKPILPPDGHKIKPERMDYTEIGLENLIQKAKKEVIENRYKILDDFCKAYLADSYIKDKEIDFSKIELVEERGKNGLETRFYFVKREE